MGMEFVDVLGSAAPVAIWNKITPKPSRGCAFLSCVSCGGQHGQMQHVWKWLLRPEGALYPWIVLR